MISIIAHGKRLKNDNFSSFSWLLLMIAAAAGVAYHSTKNLVLVTAYSAYTPVGMMHPVSNLPNMSADFVGGEEEMMKSLIARVYQFIGDAGWPDQPIAFLMTVVEASVLMAGVFSLARRLNPNAGRWAAFGASVLLATGTMASADLSRWFHPFYGSVYNYAYGLGLASITATLNRRMLLGGLLIGLTCTIHPIIALFFGLAMATVVLTDFDSYKISTLIVAVGIAGLVALLWFLFAFDGAGISGHQIDQGLYVAITKVMSSHWFPVDFGVFGTRAWESLLPGVGVVLITLSLMALGETNTKETDHQVLAILGVLLTVSLIGIAASMISTNPVVIKLALQRASLILLIIAATFSVPRLLRLAISGNALVALFAAFFILMPYWRGHGLPVASAVLFACVIVAGGSGPIAPRWRLGLAAAAAVAIAICLALIAAGHFSAIAFDINSTIAIVKLPQFQLALVLMFIAWIMRLPTAAAAAVAIGVLSWLPNTEALNDTETLADANAYLEVQHWAHDKTQPGSLFMLDPTQSYGWRQYSERPSFGIMREWLYAGWAYNTDPQQFYLGIKRAGLLGVSKKDFDIQPGRDVIGTAITITDTMKYHYNKMDASELADFAKQNQIDYFVFNRKNRTDYSGLDLVFENDFYAVVRPITGAS